MKVSLNWLREYVDIPWTVEELAGRLTAAGLEVEGVEDQAELYRGFVIGHVKTSDKHPKADRLSVCSVDVGTETLQIVCGAPNVAPGQKVIVGLVGATIPHDQHDPDGKPFVLGRVKLRGVESHGMICSEKELGLGDDGDGIMVLADDAPVGRPMSEVLHADDVILEVAITPNRADCLSHVGIARDIAALTGGTVRYPSVSLNENGPDASKAAAIEIADPDLCPRYSARIVSDITVSESPSWLQDRLRAVGMRPLNVIVDVTNYVMLELGQPLHAFDLDTVRGQKIIVRRAGADRTFTTLDGKKRDLTPDTIMICDAERPVAVGGVMGGENSEISGSTSRVLIESASFHPSSIRRTARAFGLSTEASYRFERGVDRELPARAADRAAALLQEIAGGVVHKGILDVYPEKHSPARLALRVARANEILGTDIPGDVMASYLTRLGCTVEPDKTGTMHVVPPSFRMDIGQEIDIVEEIARIHGYDNIETRTKAAIDFSTRAGEAKLSDVVRTVMVGFGYNEIMTLSLQKAEVAALMSETPIRVLNPVSAEMQALRPSLIPEGLEVVRLNLHRSRQTLRLFEVGTVFSLREGGSTTERDDYQEEERLMIVQTGQRSPAAFDGVPPGIDLLDIKGDVEALLRRLHLDNYRFIPYDARKALTEQAMSIEINGQAVGTLGEIRPDVAARADVEAPVYVCELTLGMLGDGLRIDRQYSPLPRYPSVQRDLAFVVPVGVSNASLEGTIREAAGPLLESISLFDTYTGEQVGAGKKSMAYALVFRSAEGTLKDSDVDARVRGIIDRVSREHEAELRS